jgi:aryl-alcohol dehydrogenase-like predicted oxidoreductase
MKYRAFGKTGLEVSEVIFGGGSIGGILIDPDDETKREALHRMIAVGVLVTETQHGREIQITGLNVELEEELA